MKFVFHHTEERLHDFMLRKGLSSIEEVTCEDVCADLEPDLQLQSCELIWEQEFLDGLGPLDTGVEEYRVNEGTCAGTLLESCE